MDFGGLMRRGIPSPVQVRAQRAVREPHLPYPMRCCARKPAQLRLTCANPNYASVTCLAREARIVATVLWIFRRP